MKNNLLDSTTAKLILANTIAFIAFIILGNETILSHLALQPSGIIRGEKLYTLFTSMFMHIQSWHFFGNMFTLYFIGNFVEKIVGKRRFLFVYIFSGLFAGIFWSLTSGLLSTTPLLTSIFGNPDIWGIGASGAIFGLVGILAVLTPKAKVYIIAGPLLAIILEAIITGALTKYNLLETSPYNILLPLFSLAVIIYFFIALFSILSFDPKRRNIALPLEIEMWLLPVIAIVPLMIIGLFVNLPIGNIAHLGGLIAGLGYAYILKRKFPEKSKILKGMFK
ncbi:MAG: rhomboid protease GluP [Patescibacteria group bacterium]|jgi:rhomboid protease GluP